MPEDRKLRVFLCHSSNDKPAVRELYQRLKSEGWIDPWLDEEKLYPGQDWDLEIEKAVEAADAVIVFLSNNSVSKEGYIQRELRFVLRIADFKPEGTVFVIPMRLEDCPAPRRLSMWQYVDYFPEKRKEWAYQRLLGGLKVRANKLDIPTINLAEEQARREAEEKARVAKEAFEKAQANDRARIIAQQKAKREREDQAVQNVVKKQEKKTEQLPDKLTIGDIELLRISKGKFLMGDGAEKHEVDIPYDYFLARFPVTNQLFGKFVDTTGFSKSWGVSNWDEKLDHPVINIAWPIAQDYCKWLNKEYVKELPDGYTVRLPTEAEWEKAARGPDGFLWPWGNNFDPNRCNSRESNLGSTTPVGKYSPQGDSPYGISDMAGNVWEWTHSLNKPYPYRIDDGRESNSASKGLRVRRGGSFDFFASNVRAVVRNRYNPDLYLVYFGFRVALAPHLS